MYTPKHPHIPETPTKKLKLLSALSFGAFVVMSLGVIILSLNIITLNRKLDEKDSELTSVAESWYKTEDLLKKAKTQIIAANLLPPLDSFSPQCPSGNQNDGLFTALNKTPIEGYNVFLVECRSYITTGKSLPRIIVFQVNASNGTQEFTYGSNSTEPLCISNKIPVANKLAAKLLLPVCQSN